jgi:hypothetical protein
MKTYNYKKIEKLLESNNSRTIKVFEKNGRTLYFDVYMDVNEIGINLDEVNLAVFPLSDILLADRFFIQKSQTLSQINIYYDHPVI